MISKQIINDFEAIKNLAELNALSNLSLQRPLSDSEYNRIIELKKEVFG